MSTKTDDIRCSGGCSREEMDCIVVEEVIHSSFKFWRIVLSRLRSVNTNWNYHLALLGEAINKKYNYIIYNIFNKLNTKILVTLLSLWIESLRKTKRWIKPCQKHSLLRFDQFTESLVLLHRIRHNLALYRIRWKVPTPWCEPITVAHWPKPF